MCNFRCPFADRRKCANFILCKSLEKDEVNYNDRKNALTVICLCQAQCSRTGRMENSEGARECYAKMREQSADAPKEEVAEVVEEKPTESPKKTTKKKTEKVTTESDK